MARGRYDLGDPYNGELADLCEAMDNATQRTILRRAFTEYRERMTAGNAIIGERYEALRHTRRERAAPGLHVIRPGKEC